MHSAQAGILQAVPQVGRYLLFSVADATHLASALLRLSELADGTTMVVGLGASAVAALGASVPGLREFAALSGPQQRIVSTPGALWCWLRGSDQGDLVLQARRIEQTLAGALRLEQVIDAFRHGCGPNGHGRDLTGYEDGTENPQGEAVPAAALALHGGPGIEGSSFVAVQQWLHDLDAFDAMAPTEQDASIGRRRADNEELADAPRSAHVRRTAQESFEPEAFVLRRSMPWAMAARAGLVFVAFGKSFDAFEAQLRRMIGLEDGITDALFRFSKPLNTAYFWCPPMRGGRLDLCQLGL